ncbi:MAG: twin-arginine translocase TatA/TatE family subunit [Proteobacteria bacterium]|nr:twin-arginine translocase TatA/TatE family subunit [Pseudomonadota bacterium]
MGLGGISVWQLLIILLIVIVLFGTKRLGTIGKDLGGAVKGFRKAVDDGEKEQAAHQISAHPESGDDQKSGNNRQAEDADKTQQD